MELSQLLKPEAVKLIGNAASKKRLFQELGECAGSTYGFSPALAVDALQERESLGHTGVGHGVALPHERLHGIDKIIGVFFRLEKPLNYDSVDRQPVDLVFALFAPKSSGVDHLKALALVSRSMRDDTLLIKLRANNDPAKIFTILTETTNAHAG